MIKSIFKLNLHVLLLYVLLAFPLFYFVYKFGILLQGYDDSKSYLKLFDDLTSKEVPSPFNMRLLTATCVHLMQKIGLLYNTECAIDAFDLVNKRFFFNNVLFNYICVCFTSFSVYLISVKLNFSKFLSFFGGVLYLLGFGTLFFLMMPGVDALSVLIFTWVVYFYVKQSYLIIPLFVLLIFQREYYFLAFMIIALMDYFKNKKAKYYLHIFILSILCFGIYFLLRKTLFYTKHWNHQTSPAFLLSSLFQLKIQVDSLIRQSIMTMNIYFIYIFVLLYKKMKGLEINKHYFFVTLMLLLQITLLSFAATFGNNNGRYFYLNTPLILYFMLFEINPLLQIKKTT